jgi:hypothetical protein
VPEGRSYVSINGLLSIAMQLDYLQQDNPKSETNNVTCSRYSKKSHSHLSLPPTADAKTNRFPPTPFVSLVEQAWRAATRLGERRLG